MREDDGFSGPGGMNPEQFAAMQQEMEERAGGLGSEGKREWEKERERQWREQQRARAPYTMIPEVVVDALTRDKDHLKQEHLEAAEKEVEEIVACVAKGTLPMYGEIILNRKLSYPQLSLIDSTAKQLDAIADGPLADERRWLDMPEAQALRDGLMVESHILRAEGVVLRSMVPFALGFHGWNYILGALQSKERGYDPHDPETNELYWVFTRGIVRPDEIKADFRIVEAGVEEDVEESGVFVPESEKKIAKGMSDAHYWYVAIAAVSQRRKMGEEKGIGKILNPAKKALIEEFLTQRKFSIKKDASGNIDKVTETEGIANVFAMRQDVSDIKKVQRFVRTCIRLGVWDELSGGGGVSDDRLNEIKQKIKTEMGRMGSWSGTIMEGKLRDPYLLETKAETMSLAMMRAWGLGGLLGARVATERQYCVGGSDRVIRIGGKEVGLRLETFKDKFGTGDTRAAGGDWDIRWPLMFATNSAFKAWNEGRLGLTGSEIAEFRRKLNTSFDRDELKGIDNGPVLPPNLVVSFMEFAKVDTVDGKKSLFELFLDGVPLYALPVMELRGNEYYKWLIQMSQARLILEVVFVQDEDGKRNSAWEKFVKAPQGLNHLLKRIALATGHNKDESEVWMAGLVAMMYGQRFGLSTGEYYVTDNKRDADRALEDIKGALKKMAWRDDASFGRRVEARFSKMIENEKKRMNKR